MQDDSDALVIEAALKVLTNALDEFVGACYGQDGKIKAPDMRDVMRARSMLPTSCKYTLTKRD